MVSLMAGLAKRYEVTWRIATCLSAFQVVNIQNRVFALALAMNTPMPIPCKNIFPHVPKPHLLTLLVLLTLVMSGLLIF